MTLAEMVTNVASLINQSLADDTLTITRTEVKAFLNIGYAISRNALLSMSEDYGVRLARAEVKASENYYLLPTNCRKLRRVEVSYDGTNYYRVQRINRNAIEFPDRSWSESAPCYSLVGNNIELFPTPTANVTNGLRLWYVEDNGDLSGDDSEVKLPNAYTHLPIMYASAMAKKKLGLDNESAQELGIFNAQLEIMKNEVLNQGDDSPEYVVIRDIPDVF